MSNAATLTARTAAALEEIGQARARLAAITAAPATDSETRGEMVMLERTLEDLHLLVIADYGRWKRGEISGTALSDRLGVWDLQPA